MTLQTIEKLECVPGTPEDLRDLADQLNLEAAELNSQWNELQSDRAELAGSDTQILLGAAERGRFVDLLRTEQEILEKRRDLHGRFLEFGRSYIPATREIVSGLAEAVRETREQIEAGLEALGFKRPGGTNAEAFDIQWIERHAAVKKATAEWKIGRDRFSEGAFLHQHETAIEAIDGALQELQKRVAEWSGLAGPVESESVVVPMNG